MLVPVAVASAPADAVTTDSIHYRYDRLYFPLGEEHRVYRYSPFEITRRDTVLYQGYVEHSWTGVAASFPTAGFFDTLDVASLHAVLETAELDSSSGFTVGVDPRAAALSDTMRAPGVRLEIYRDAALLWEDFAEGVLDGVVTLERAGPISTDGETISGPWPYVAMLVPNVRRSCNFNGQLTTSLFYRFDPDRLDLVWEGDARPVYGNAPAALARMWSQRPYTYSPATGRSLLGLVRDLPAVIKLYCDGLSLQPTALFFADILAQDRCRVELVNKRAEADVYVEFVPVSASLPALTAHRLRYELSRDTLTGSPPAQYVAQIGRNMDYLATAASEEDYYHIVQQVERKLSEDLGVFPLFYPVYYFHSQPNVRGVVLDAAGQIDFSHAYRVILPSPPESRP